MARKAFVWHEKMSAPLLKEYESQGMTWSASLIGYSGRSVENGVEGVKTGSRRMTLEAFDITGVMKRW